MEMQHPAVGELWSEQGGRLIAVHLGNALVVALDDEEKSLEILYEFGAFPGASFAGFTDWRAPEIAELQQIIEQSAAMLQPDVLYWSATALDDVVAWACLGVYSFTAAVVGRGRVLPVRVVVLDSIERAP